MLHSGSITSPPPEASDVRPNSPRPRAANERASSARSAIVVLRVRFMIRAVGRLVIAAPENRTGTRRFAGVPAQDDIASHQAIDPFMPARPPSGAGLTGTG